MKRTRSHLSGSLIKIYYQKNVVFYLLVVLLAFGFMRSQEHILIAKLVLPRSELLFIVGLLWLLHVIKTNFFVHQMLGSSDFEYLIDFELLSPRHKLVEVLWGQFLLNLPFIAYGCFWVAIAIHERAWDGLLSLVFVNSILWVLPSIWFWRRFHRFRELRESMRHYVSYGSIPWPKTARLWFIRYLLSDEPILLLTTKIFSFLLIIGICSLYPTDDYDVRLMYLMSFFVGLGHIVVGKAYRHYLAFETLVLRNLPSSLSQRSNHIFLSSLVISAFEILLFMTYLPAELSIWEGLGIYFLLLGVIYFWLSLAYYNQGYTERFGMRIYLVCAVILVLIMYAFSPFVLGGGFILLGLSMVFTYYDSFEPS